LGKLHFISLKYSPIFIFAFKVSSVTLNFHKLSDCGSLTPLIFLFPKCHNHIFLFKKSKKKREKTKKIYKYMLGWPNHPIGGGWPPRLAWGGSAAPWANRSHFRFWAFGPRGS
jgi:hypothetical protein